MDGFIAITRKKRGEWSVSVYSAWSQRDIVEGLIVVRAVAGVGFGFGVLTRLPLRTNGDDADPPLQSFLLALTTCRRSCVSLDLSVDLIGAV